MAKITIEAGEYLGQGKVSSVEREKFFQIANKVFALLEKIGYDYEHNFLKVKLCKFEMPIENSKREALVLSAEFQLVFYPPLMATLKPREVEVRVIAQWWENKKEKLIVYKNAIEESNRLNDVHLPSDEVETWATTLLSVIQVGIIDRQVHFNDVQESLRVVRIDLEHLIQSR